MGHIIKKKKNGLNIEWCHRVSSNVIRWATSSNGLNIEWCHRVSSNGAIKEGSMRCARDMGVSKLEHKTCLLAEILFLEET